MQLRCTALAVLLVLTVFPRGAAGQDDAAVVTAAVRAMGVEDLGTLILTGSGSMAGVGQNVHPIQPWPLVRLETYTYAIDFDRLASNFEAVRIQNGARTPQNRVVPADAPWTRRSEVWVTTPYAFLKGALTHPVTVRTGTFNEIQYTIVSFTLEDRYTVEGYIDDDNRVARVHTWVDNDVLGDMPVEGVYGDYQDFSGLQVPTLTIVKQGGFPTLITGVQSATINPAVAIPAAPAPAAPPDPTVEAERVTDGIHYLKGGSHHSVLVEFADHLTLIEAPQNEARARALIAKIDELYPDKPLTQVVNTHHHFDHSGGLRTFVDAGATIVTHEINRSFFEQAFQARRTLNPDRLELSKRAADIMTVGEKLVLSDATRTLELHEVRDNAHNDGLLVAFLPQEKLLVQVDLYTPPAPGAPAGAASTTNAEALLNNLERLRLDFETILPLHGQVTATRADLYEFTGKPLAPVSSLPDPDQAPAEGQNGAQ